ncbi:hypothetical protein EDB19DRAFT_583046 [Suillus lakei]|nr:hypothetical protein EDB19DRAFT_583046 [Suillus lakei]
MPGFAMSTHKAQGQTLQRVIIDLEGCAGTEAPYVMLSRVTSLEGRLILRPFNQKKISCRRSEDSCIEDKRQQILALQTIADTGERMSAQHQLQMFLGTGDVTALAYYDFTVADGDFQAHGQVPTPAYIALQVNRIETETERVISNSDCRKNNKR